MICVLPPDIQANPRLPVIPNIPANPGVPGPESVILRLLILSNYIDVLKNSIIWTAL